MITATELLDDRSPIDPAPRAEYQADGVLIRAPPVRRKLDAVVEPSRKVDQEAVRAVGAAIAYGPSDDQLGVGVDGGPGPNRAVVGVVFLTYGHVAVLRPAEGPNLIALDEL